jgi:hypothetical protein
MAKLILNGATSGSISLESPAVSGTTTLTLPTTSGTIALSGGAVSGTTGSFSGDLSFNSGYGSAATAYGCRAWVNFNGTGTVAIRASGNVSSITDNGTGDYTVNFTNALVDANYVEILAVGRLNDRNNLGTLGIQTTYAGNKTTTFARLITQSSTLTFTDMDMVDVAIFR